MPKMMVYFENEICKSAAKAAEKVISNLNDRRGIDIDCFDEDIKKEIQETCTDIIKKEIEKNPIIDSLKWNLILKKLVDTYLVGDYIILDYSTTNDLVPRATIEYKDGTPTTIYYYEDTEEWK